MKRAAYKLHLKKDDIVQVIAGKEKGKKGKKMNVSSIPKHKAPVITLLGHKYDKNKLDPYTKIKDGEVFTVPRKDFEKFKILRDGNYLDINLLTSTVSS